MVFFAALERQTACSMHFNPKGQRPFVGKRLSTARKSHRRPGEGRGLPFLLREERGAKKRKRDRLGPFSNPHEVPVQEAVRNHRAYKSPCGEFVRGGSVSLLQVNLLRGRQFARHRLRPPLSFAHSGVSRSKPRGSRGCNPLPVFAYFLLGRKYGPLRPEQAVATKLQFKNQKLFG